MKKKRIAAFALATMLFSSTASGVTAASGYTWKYQNNNWYYQTSGGKNVTGWVLDNKSWYFLGSNGVMKTGWLLDKNRWYFLDKKSGAMKTGWLKDGNTWYFLDSSGAMKTGWLLNANTWYFLQPSGAMKTGWLLNGGKWYFLNTSGAMKTGWLANANNWYFLDSSGAMKTGWIEDKKLKYYLKPSGEMITGQKYIDGEPYVFSASGALDTNPITGWFRDGSIIIYFDKDGSKHTGWLVDGSNKYYFSEEGFIQTGWLTEGSNKYYFGSDGKMQTGLQTIDNQIYYFGTDGALQTANGWKQIESKWYYFGSEGAAYKGWLTDGAKKFYLGSDGTMVTGWLLDNNNWYFMNSSGVMTTGWILDNGKKYFLNNNGIMQTGWLTDNAATYYLNKSGAITIGWLDLDNKKYYFDPNGKMVTGEQVIDGKLYTFFENGVLNTGPIIQTTNYNLTFEQMLDIEMKQSPQTDKYRNNKAYVSSDFVLQDAKDPKKGVVTGTSLNVREDTNNNAFVYGTLKQGAQVTIVSQVGTWYEIAYVTWRNAKSTDVAYYLNPTTFSPTDPEYFQFLLLNKSAGTTAQDLNAKVLLGKGILAGKGEAFLKAGKQNNVNEVYLVAHALLETGNGKSNLANGIVVDTVDGKKLDKPVTVYNMFGIGAIDTCPETCGAQTAYKKGWFTPEDAIIGGAAFIGDGYINAKDPQNTLYKMRWNPNVPWHQYATDIGWSVKQVNNIKKVYDSLSSYTLYFDIPVYK